MNSCSLVIPPLGELKKWKTGTHTHARTHTFTAALFTRARWRRQVDRSMDTVVCPSYRMFLSQKHTRNTGTRYHMHDPEKRSVEWQRPGTKGHMLHDCTRVKQPELVTPRDRARLVAARNWGATGQGSNCLMATGSLLGRWKCLGARGMCV